MNKPVLIAKHKCLETDNYIREYFENQNSFPNPKPVEKYMNDDILKNNAQEMAYWTQYGTATFQVNKDYQETGLKLEG